MVRDFLGWSKWSPHLGNAITIGLGLPTVTGFIAGWWAYWAPNSGLVAAEAALAVFVMALWAAIGMIWLRDRAKQLSPKFVVADYDCSWSVTIEQAFLTKDPTNLDAKYQLKIFIVNQSEIPIQYYIDGAEVQLNNCIPPNKGNRFVPGILARWGGRTRVYFPSFENGQLPESGRLRGSGKLILKYGHPSVGFSRLTTYQFDISCNISPPWNPTAILKGGAFPVELSIRGMDEVPIPIQNSQLSIVESNP